jgi:hypothetical protein
MSDPGFSFRWGIDLLDAGHVQIPNFILRNYIEAGIKRHEMLLIIHLASYKYESPNGCSKPALTTIADELGYTVQRVCQILNELEKRELLIRKRTPGFTTEYNFQPFSQKVLALAATQANLSSRTQANLSSRTQANLSTGLKSTLDEEEKRTKEKQHSANAECSPRSEKSPPSPPSNSPSPSKRREEPTDELSEFGLTGELWHEKHGKGNGNLSPPKGDEPWLRWGDGQVNPRPGVSARDLQRVGWLVEKVFDLVPVGKEWRSWTSAFAQMYEVAEGDFELIERGITLAWEREAKYRPTHPNGFVKAIRKAAMDNGSSPNDSGIWGLDRWEEHERLQRERRG